MAQVTRLSSLGIGADAYGTFAPKTDASTGQHNPGIVTRLACIGIGAAKYGTFLPKTQAVVAPQFDATAAFWRWYQEQWLYQLLSMRAGIARGQKIELYAELTPGIAIGNVTRSPTRPSVSTVRPKPRGTLGLDPILMDNDLVQVLMMLDAAA